MSKSKFSDEQIIKAIELCWKGDEYACEKCPLENPDGCRQYDITWLAIDLLQRQQKNLETLKMKFFADVYEKTWTQRIGTAVYIVGYFTGDVIEAKVTTVSFNGEDVFLHLDNGCVVSKNQQIGKSVFFDKNNAEKAMDIKNKRKKKEER